MQYLNGYKVHLVLEDDNGQEFEVRDPLTWQGGSPAISEGRLFNACDEREMSRVPMKRPVF